MTSLRRSSSSATDRSLPNGVSDHFPATSPSAASVACTDVPETNGKIDSHFSFLSYFQRRDAADRSKVKGNIWKKPFLPVMMCFFLGFFAGLIPFTSTTTTEYKSDAAQEEIDLDVKVFPTHLQQELNNIGYTERNTEAKMTGSFSALNLSDKPDSSQSLPEQISNSVDISDSTLGKLLIIVTPTYNRPFQALYLTRLSHTLKLVPPPLLWIVVEMSTQSVETAKILRKTGLMYRHLVCEKNMTDIKDRGVHQRNVAIAHIERHQLNGVVYFADDDNVYTLELFEQMRKIKRFGTWPVAMLSHDKSKAVLEGPVCDGHTVIGWHTNEKSKRLRRFHVDMSGFAFNSTILWDPRMWRRPTVEPIRQLDTVKEGFQETTFIEQLVEDESQMEGLPSGCSKIMIWHLHVEAHDLAYPAGWVLQENLNATITFQ